MRREYNGHPAETPTAVRPRDHGHARTQGGLHGDVTHKSRKTCRTGWKRGTLVCSLLAGPGSRPWARKPGKRENHTEKKNRKEHSVIVMFPHISMPVRYTMITWTFRSLEGPSDTGSDLP